MKVIVSACLLGVPCRYKGGANTDKGVISFVAGMDVIPVCPEVAAGMPIPRPPVEILRGRIVRKDGTDMDVLRYGLLLFFLNLYVPLIYVTIS